MNFEQIGNWKPRNSWKYRINVELQNLMMNLKTDCSFNETMKLHLINLGIGVSDEVFS